METVIGALLLVAGIVAVLYALVLQGDKPRGCVTFMAGIVAMFGGLLVWLGPPEPYAHLDARGRAMATIAAATAIADTADLERQAATAAAAVTEEVR